MHPESQAALQHVRQNVSPGKRVVFVSGNFNIVHPGHLRLLKFAADCGDYLIVGISDQSAEGVHLAENLRLEGVKSISFVNHAFVLRERPEQFIASLKPAFVVKGKEHQARHNPELRAVEAYGGKLLFSSGEVRFSSVDLLQKEFHKLNVSTIAKPTDFLNRHGFTFDDLRATIKKFGGLKLTVIGDLIVDEYINCEPLGMSQEDPTLVVSPIYQERFLGGAAIVAAHARGLGADVNYLTVSGKDPVATFAAEKLVEYGVNAKIFQDSSRPTTLKQKFRAGGKTLLRVSHLRQHDINQDLAADILSAMRDSVPRSDLVVFSDFNYGCLPQSLVDAVCSLGKETGVPMVADSQSSSQVGDVSRFQGMLLLTPTEREARLAVRDFSSGLVVLAEALREKTRARNVVITLGSEGVLAHAAMENSQERITDQLPTFNTAPKDFAGAGDSFLTCAAMALVSGATLWKSIYLGSLAAACQIGRVGNIPLTPGDIEAEIDA